MFKRLVWFCLVFFVVLSFGAVAFSDEIKVGVVLPLTGEGQEDGMLSLWGVQLANEQHIKVKDKVILLEVKDDNTNPQKSGEAVRELAKEGVIACIGWPWSGLALGAAPVAEELKVPMVCTWATNPKVTEGKKYVSRTAFIDTFGGKIIATFLVKEKGLKNIAIIQDTKQPYSTGLAEITKKEIEAMGSKAKIFSVETGIAPEKMEKVIEEVVALKPDGVVFTVYAAELGMAIKMLKDKGCNAVMIAGDTGGAPSLPQRSEGAINGMYFYDHFHPDGAQTKMAKEFVKLFQQKYGRLPYAAAAVAYDAYLIVYNAIKNCVEDGKPLTRDNVNYYIRHTKDLEGVSGVITIDPETGNPTKPAFLCQWQDDTIKFIKVINP